MMLLINKKTGTLIDVYSIWGDRLIYSPRSKEESFNNNDFIPHIIKEGQAYLDSNKQTQIITKDNINYYDAYGIGLDGCLVSLINIDEVDNV